MFDFALTPDQRTLRDAIRQFAKDEVMPISADSVAKRQMPVAVAEAFHKAGFPTAYYEHEADHGLVTDGAIISEELGYADASFASYLMLPVFFNRLLLGYLSGAARERLTEASGAQARGHLVRGVRACRRQ